MFHLFISTNLFTSPCDNIRAPIKIP
jgi:hypothetical protein